MCVILYKCCQARRNTRIGTFTRDIHVSGKIIANFLDRRFQFKQSELSAQMWRRLRNIHVLHVQTNGDSPVSLAVTHMRGYTAKVGTRAQGTQIVVPNIGGLRDWPDRCSIKDSDRSERETTPCACEQAQRKRQKEWEKSRVKRGEKQKNKTTTHEGQPKQHSMASDARSDGMGAGPTWAETSARRGPARNRVPFKCNNVMWVSQVRVRGLSRHRRPESTQKLHERPLSRRCRSWSRHCC